MAKDDDDKTWAGTTVSTEGAVLTVEALEEAAQKIRDNHGIDAMRYILGDWNTGGPKYQMRVGRRLLHKPTGIIVEVVELLPPPPGAIGGDRIRLKIVDTSGKKKQPHSVSGPKTWIHPWDIGLKYEEIPTKAERVLYERQKKD